MTTTVNIGSVGTFNVFLAPMAGSTDKAFRKMCRKYGAGLVCTEMVSAKGLYYNNANTQSLLGFDADERPVAAQIFGSDPAIMAEAARQLTNFDVIDINMGCPAPKIVKNGEGSALMKNPALIGEIVRAVVNAVNVPVTVKMRKGFDETRINAAETAKIIEDAGASAITVHGRTRAQMFAGPVDLEIISAVVNAVNIPVIGNGDIDCPEKAREMFEKTACGAVMIGRAAEGDPHIFKRVRDFLSGETAAYLTPRQKAADALEHLKLAIEDKGERRGVIETRRQLCKYIKCLDGAAEARVNINNSTTFDEIEKIFEKFF